MKVCVTVVLVLLVHQICAYPVSSREQVTDLERALASLLVRAQLREQAELQQMVDDCPEELWCEGLCQLKDRSEIARIQNPCRLKQAQVQEVYAQNTRHWPEEHSKLNHLRMQQDHDGSEKQAKEVRVQNERHLQEEQSRLDRLQEPSMQQRGDESEQQTEMISREEALAQLLALIQRG